MKIFYMIKNILIGWFSKPSFVKSEPDETQVGNPQFPIKPDTPIPLPAEPIAEIPNEDIFKTWTRIAMSTSGAFEGKGEDWGNPVGDFDGAGLTCGLLGFTWKYDNQPPMIKEFIRRHGRELIFKLMPKTGFEYLEAVNEGSVNGHSTVSGWSSGERVHEPYKSELFALWDSPQMRQIQIEKAWEMMGAWAKKKCLETQAFYKLPEPKLSHFCYWFDQAVLNGQGKTVQLETASQDELDEVINWCSYVGGYNKGSIRACGKIWKDQLLKASDDQKGLFVMAYRRSQLSKKAFGATTMCRRGSLALGIGVVNGEKRQYSWKI